MAINKNGIVVLGAVFVDIKGYSEGIYIPNGRNGGTVEYIHGGNSRKQEYFYLMIIHRRPLMNLRIYWLSARSLPIARRWSSQRADREQYMTMPGAKEDSVLHGRCR